MAPREYPPASGKKTAIVTGGSSGIGKASALSLARDGWNVLISARRIEQLQSTAQEIDAATREIGPRKRGQCKIFAGDMTEEESVRAMFRTAHEAFGQIDLIFINAGISSPAKPLQEVTLEEWNRVVNINLTGAWLCAREAFIYMDGSKGTPLGGRIILNGSISAHTPRPFSSPYTSTKHAISGLTKSLALDGRKHNISVCQIDIGNAASEMTVKMAQGPGVLQADGKTLAQEPVFEVEHVGTQIAQIAAFPLHVTVQNITILANNMPSFIGRG